MLKRTAIITFCYLMLITGLSLYLVLNDSNDSIPIKSKKEVSYHPTKQIRRGVQKDLWMSTENGRLHHQLKSPYSILTATPKGNNFELIEDMQDMKCYLQEFVEDTYQQIRLIESKLGTYRYQNNRFDAEEVFLTFFQLPGKMLTTRLNLEQAFLDGVAKDVSLSFYDNSPDFHAETFKARIIPHNKERNE